MLRSELIERVIRNVFGGQPTDDASITANLVNKFIEDGCAIAAKANYKDSIQLDGVTYVNNSFYTTYKGITFSNDEKFAYVATLPKIPLGLGKNEGIASLRVKDGSGNVSLDALPLSENQWTYYQSMPMIPNKLLYKPEGIFVYVLSVLQLNVGYTANITMVSSGDDTNLSSVLNVPQDYIPIIFDYCVKALMQQRAAPKDIVNDGEDNV
jgi:hypothetical protein